MKIFLIVLLTACTLVAGEWKVEKNADGLVFTEGPVGFDGDLIFSDVQSNTLYGWTEKDSLRVSRKPSEKANGNILDPQGRLVISRHGARDVIRTEPDGKTLFITARTAVYCAIFQGELHD